MSALIVDQKFRKAHHVHEQDMGDFKMKIRFYALTAYRFTPKRASQILAM